MKKLMCLYILLAAFSACKKDNSKTAQPNQTPTPLPYDLLLMNGNHAWHGKEFFMNYDTSTGLLYQDSSIVSFEKSIRATDSGYIDLSDSVGQGPRLWLTITDTVNKVLVFTKYFQASGPYDFQSWDSLSFFYSVNSFYWVQRARGGIIKTERYVYSP